MRFFLDANQSLLLMRTEAQELRLIPRFEIEMRERAAPLVILLDILMLICFVREERRGVASSSLNLQGQGKKGMRRTIHCIEVCEKRDSNMTNHCREECLIGQQIKKIAKSRWIASQNAIAKVLTLRIFFSATFHQDAAPQAGSLSEHHYYGGTSFAHNFSLVAS